MCNELTRSRVESKAEILPDVDLAKSPDDLAVYIVFLKCAKLDCESPVVLFAPVKNDVRDADLTAHIHENWSIHGAVCAKGYPPAYPYELRVWKQLEAER